MLSYRVSVNSMRCERSSTSSVLTKENEAGEEYPIVYLSRTLNKHELNYMVSEKELLVVVWSIEKLRPYIEGYHFMVVTDHCALKWMKHLKDPTGKLAKWAIKLQQWDFEIVHRKGWQHLLRSTPCGELKEDASTNIGPTRCWI